MKLAKAYEMVRPDSVTKMTKRKIDQNKWSDPNKDNNDEITSTEITSTGSFLSNLSEISQTEDDYIGNTQAIFTSRHLSKEFNTLFDDKENLKNDTKSTNEGLHEKTFHVNANPSKKRDQCLDESLSFDDDSESNHKVKSPPKRAKKNLRVSAEYNRSRQLSPKEEQTLRAMSSDEIDSNPIYERIDIESSSFDLDNMQNWQNAKRNVTKAPSSLLYGTDSKTSSSLLYGVDPKSVLLINPICQHTFAHRTASRSVVCFLCSKK